MSNSNDVQPSGSKRTKKNTASTESTARTADNIETNDPSQVRQLEGQLKALRIDLQSKIDELEDNQQELEKRIFKSVQTEQALLENEQRIRSIVNTAADAIISINRTGMIEHYNLAAEKMFGYAAAEAIGCNVNILMPSPYREQHNEYLARYHDTHRSAVIGFTREIIARHKSGRIFPIELSVSEVDHHQCYTGIIRDLSRHRKLELELLTIADKTQRKIGQNLHDDIGQEMTGLILKTEALQDTISQQDQAGLSLISDIISGLDRTRAKISVLSKGLVPVAVDSRGLIVALEELTAEISAVYHISCTLSSTDNVTISNSSIATQLYRITQEAISNAIRHGQAQHIRILLKKSGQRFTLSIEDDGMGLPATATKASSGMGLHIMEYRCRLFGGKLVIEAGKTGGVTVSCSFERGLVNGT